MRYNNLIGGRYGRLVVIEYVGNYSKNRQALFNCLCDCGKQAIARGSSLTSGKTKSCGCLHKEISADIMKIVNASGQRNIMASTTHGKSNHPLYLRWSTIKTRCTNKKHEHYKDYGGRGIMICNEWANNFSVFYDWAINNGYADNLEIDRIDSNKGYSPDNCRWVNKYEQAVNRRNSVFLSDGIVEKPLRDWCSEKSVEYKLAHARYKKGWSFNKIFGGQAYALGVAYIDMVEGREANDNQVGEE